MRLRAIRDASLSSKRSGRCAATNLHLRIALHYLVPFLLTSTFAKMAYNGYGNGYGDDQMDIDASGPKVTVREVRRESP